MVRRGLISTALVAFAIVAHAAGQLSPSNSPEANGIQALVEKTAKVDEQGGSALEEMRTKGGEWWSGDVYVFAHAPDGTVLLNPAVPARRTRVSRREDKMGKAFHDEILKTAQSNGSGWVDYWLPKPGQTEPSHNWSYVKAVKADGVALVGAGFLPD